MVLDEAKHRLLIVGGASHRAVWGDAWEIPLDGAMVPHRITDSWQERFGPRGSLVLDTRRNQLITYGGRRESPVDGPPGSWTGDDRPSPFAASASGHGTWHPLTDLYTIDASTPAPRHDQVAVYDPVRDRMVVFGGMSYDALYGFLDVEHPRPDLWQLQLGPSPAWSALTASGEAPSRTVGSAVIDAGADAMWYVADGSVWRLDLTTTHWDSLPVAGPRPGARATVALDRAAQRVYAFDAGELWSLELHAPWTWTHLDVPGDRPDAGPIAWDPFTARLYAFSGGEGDLPWQRSAPAILWTIAPGNGASWTRAYDGRVPGAVVSAGVYDARRDRILSVDRTHALDGLYELRAGDAGWRALSLPSSRETYLLSLALDETADRLVANVSDPVTNQVGNWSLDLSVDEGWLPVGPPDDGLYTLGWDAAHQRVVRFGWTSVDAPVQVQWLEGGKWHPMVSVGDAPPFHAYMSVASDPERGRMFATGGLTADPSSQVDHLWTVEFGDTARWSARAFYAWHDAWDLPFVPIAYDPVRHVVVMHALYSVSAGWTTEGTELQIDAVAGSAGYGQLMVLGEYATPVRQANGLVYDSVHDRLITFGGLSLHQTPGDTLIDAYAASSETPVRTIRVDVSTAKASPGTHATVQAAALSEPGFDARQIDLATVRVAGVPVRRDGAGRPLFVVRDVDRDGLDDIVVHFDAHDLPLTEANKAVKLWGRTFADQRFEGIGAVTVNTPGRQDAPLLREATAGASTPTFTLGVAADHASFECRISALPGARVELFDVAGRSLATALAGGGAVQTLRLVPASRPTPGLYFARLTGPATLTRKVVVLR